MHSNQRKSTIQLGEVYFWTATIHQWKHLLKPNKYKQIIIDSLQNLVARKLITVYGYVIMPNHLHLIWEMNGKNGKELPSASFLKWIAHQIRNDLEDHHPKVLEHFMVDMIDRRFEFWQRDSLALLLNGRKMCEQKLEYMHLNPLQAHWNLAVETHEYFWSSANYYENSVDDSGVLTHYMDRF